MTTEIPPSPEAILEWSGVSATGTVPRIGAHASLETNNMYILVSKD